MSVESEQHEIVEPESYEQDGVVFYKEPWEVSYADWLHFHDEPDFIADEIGDGRLRVYCYSANNSFSAELDKVSNMYYPEKGIHNGLGIPYWGYWL